MPVIPGGDGKEPSGGALGVPPQAALAPDHGELVGAVESVAETKTVGVIDGRVGVAGMTGEGDRGRAQEIVLGRAETVDSAQLGEVFGVNANLGRHLMIEGIDSPGRSDDCGIVRGGAEDGSR